MAKYVCSVCGFEYDEAIGIPEAGIAPGTKWEDLPRGLGLSCVRRGEIGF